MPAVLTCCSSAQVCWLMWAPAKPASGPDPDLCKQAAISCVAACDASVLQQLISAQVPGRCLPRELGLPLARAVYGPSRSAEAQLELSAQLGGARTHTHTHTLRCGHHSLPTSAVASGYCCWLQARVSDTYSAGAGHSLS